MKILVTCPGFPPAYLGGGPIRTIAAMCDTAAAHHDVLVLTNNFDHGSEAPLVSEPGVWMRRGRTKVMYVAPGMLNLARGVRSALSLRPDAIYLNGFFYPRLSILFQIVTMIRPSQTVAIAPRGEMDPGALSIKPRKKRLFITLIRATGLFEKAIWHASSSLEEGNIRRVVGQGARVIVRENDNELPDRAMQVPARRPGALRVVFMSRIAPKKGLHVALQAMSKLSVNIIFDIIGPLEDADYIRRCERLAAETPECVKVRFLGPVDHSKIRPMLNQYDVMVLPTAGENFGHVIAESLSASVPVICTNTTPWSRRLDSGGGVVIADQDPSSWREVLLRYSAEGAQEWLKRRVSAGGAYNGWKSEAKAEHFFDLLQAEISTPHAGHD